MQNEKLIANYFLTKFIMQVAEFRSCKGYFLLGATFKPAL